ncbi:nSTAND1 domain-containing NTPase [Microcoleus sp. BROC3]|uniref:nSTAND1 domain-containing NTPase n=1 Tax=Microcoleus sp. BROC3 TaxID=3055323 RepID=UPI002FCFA16B
MSAFRAEDKNLFFGREEFVKQLVKAVKQHPLVPVIGASGSGKSSVVLAGLIPCLRKEETWLIGSFRPQSQPFYGLAAALVSAGYPQLNKEQPNEKTSKLFEQMQGSRKLWQEVTDILTENPGKKLLLIIDQFEELYALDSEEQKKFVEALLEAVKKNPIRFKLVLTIRTDFLDHIIKYPPFKEAALQSESHKFLGAMNPEEMKSVIELIDRDTQENIVELEDRLTQRILDDVQQEPGNLPLLEFTLTQLWKENRGGRLTLQAYEKIGGVKKALANHADKIYHQLNEEERKQAQQIFLRLASLGEQAEDITLARDTRRLATSSEIGEDNWQLVMKLAGSDRDIPDRDKQLPLLVTGRNDKTGEQTVEVVHEALIREWGKLREWIEDDRAFLTWRHQLQIQMAQWNSADKDEGALLRGKPLVIAEDWLQKRPAELINERKYIEQSLQLRKRRRRTIISVLTGFLLVAGVQWGQTENQKQQLEISQAELRINYSNALFNEGQQFDALMEALRVAKPLRSQPKPPMEVVTALRQAIYRVGERNRLGGHSDWINTVSFSPDRKTLASGSRDSTIKLWNVSTGQLIRTINDSKSIVSVSFSPDGKTLASNSGDKSIKLWNVATGKEIKTLNGHSNWVRSLSFSPDSKTLASGSDDKSIKLWNVATGKEIKTLNGHSNVVNSVSFSPDGKTLASSSNDKTIKIWDVATGKEMKSLNGHKDLVKSVSFNPKGKTLASGSDDNTIKIWNVATGQAIKTLNGHNAFIYSVSFSPDGKTLASGSDDNTMKLWNVDTGEVTINFNEHKDSISSVSFSPDGKTLASGSFDKIIKIWNVSIGEEKSLKEHKDPIFGVSFSHDGKILASGGFDNTIKLWNVDTGEAKTLKGHKGAIQSVSFSPDGKILASGSRDKTIKLWELKTGKEIKTLNGHSNSVRSLSFSPDGKILASGSADKTIKLWDVAQRKDIKTLDKHSEEVNSVSFSPDGKTLASGSDDETIKLWDVATGEDTTLYGHDFAVYSVSFSPDGKTLASGSQDKTIKLWDVGADQAKKTFTGHIDSVWSVSFSPDGKTLASGSSDKTIQLWDVDTGKKITIDRDIDGHSEAVNSVSFSPDGKTLASGSDDSTVILWNFDFNNLLVRSCNWMRPYLQNNPNLSESDKQLCNDIGTQN